jgi:hypothetical protein
MKKVISMYRPKIALITGASSGIGFEFAKISANLGSELILISSNTARLAQIKDDFENKLKTKVHIIPCDLTQTNSIDLIKDYLEKSALIPDLLINNAGIGHFGSYIDSDYKKDEETIQLNILAMSALCKLISKKMSENGGGIILNVSSSIAFRNDPNWVVYAASKAYILSFTRSLALELKNSKVKVFVLCPGKTDTNFDIGAENPNSKGKRKRSAEFVAKYALDNLEKNKTIIIPGIENKIKYLFFKYLPLFLTDLILPK